MIKSNDCPVCKHLDTSFVNETYFIQTNDNKTLAVVVGSELDGKIKDVTQSIEDFRKFLREKAIKLYSPKGLTGFQLDWVTTGKEDDDGGWIKIDGDVKDLYFLMLKTFPYAGKEYNHKIRKTYDYKFLKKQAVLFYFKNLDENQTKWIDDDSFAAEIDKDVLELYKVFVEITEYTTEYTND